MVGLKWLHLSSTFQTSLPVMSKSINYNISSFYNAIMLTNFNQIFIWTLNANNKTNTWDGNEVKLETSLCSYCAIDKHVFDV